MKWPVSTREGGQSINLAPDVCFVPAPPPPPAGVGGIPTPFPNMASHSGCKKGTTTKVFVRGKLCLIEGSWIKQSSGDEPGCSTIQPPGKMGLKSRTHMAKCEFTQHSSKVKMQGKGVICHTASSKQNKGNTIGKHSVPSQSVVLAEM